MSEHYITKFEEVADFVKGRRKLLQRIKPTAYINEFFVTLRILEEINQLRKAEYDTLKQQRDDLLARCKKICEWLDILIHNAENQLATCHFESLNEALRLDIKNYKSTKKDVEQAIAAAEKKGGK